MSNFTKLAETALEMEAEIARLRTEMERLQFIEADWIGLKSLLKHRDETLARWPRAERVVELENALAKANAVVRAAETFAKKFATLQEAIGAAFEFQQVHGIVYYGENYREEWKTLQAEIAAYRERA